MGQQHTKHAYIICSSMSGFFMRMCKVLTSKSSTTRQETNKSVQDLRSSDGLFYSKIKIIIYSYQIVHKLSQPLLFLWQPKDDVSDWCLIFLSPVT